MNNKLIFRILGALACALIIASVFVPYVNISGYTQNLWNSYETVNSLYLPIMIIVFGVIGVMFFALNIKTEFAYMTTGAILFFLVMQTIVYLDSFSALSLGYYFQVVGAILTGVMAFLCNLKPKIKEQTEQPVEQNTQGSMLDQIDKLYSEQQTQEQEQIIQTVNPVIQPIQPIQNVEPIQPIVQESVQQVIEQPVQEIQPIPQVIEQPVQEVQPISQINQVQQSVQEVQPVVESVNQTNPVLQEFAQPTNVAVEQIPVQPVNNISVQAQQPVNPVLQEFSFGNVNSQPLMEPQQPVQEVQPQPVVESVNQTNPVLQDFMNPSASTLNDNQNTNSLDIFGQPINK